MLKLNYMPITCSCGLSRHREVHRLQSNQAGEAGNGGGAPALPLEMGLH